MPQQQRFTCEENHEIQTKSFTWHRTSNVGSVKDSMKEYTIQVLRNVERIPGQCLPLGNDIFGADSSKTNEF